MQVFIEVTDADQSAAPETGVIGLHTVGHHQPGLPPGFDIIWQIVIQTGAVVDEPPFIHHQVSGVQAGAVAGEPAHRTLAGGAFQRSHGLGDGLPLGVDVLQVIFLPTVAVAADLVALGGDLPGNFGVALQCQGAREECGADAVALKHVQQPPDANAATVFEERLVVQVPVLGRNGRRHLAVGLMVGVAVQR